jgi:hypothetical protein
LQKNIVTDLDKSSSSVEIEMQVLNLSKLGKGLMQVILLSFFVDTSNQNNPTLNS